ncbi:tRNA (adenosine(37)-N6)-threonylcarbamoyltransferase complex transferase subunit TsaD [Patescibacteria group bacterium]
MKILAIETSCDETAISILNIKHSVFNILSNVISSQVKIHAKWGGVVPTLAKREHLKNLPTVLEKALSKAKIKNPSKEIDIIAVTHGPGLEPALWTGINFAEDLAKKWNKPLVPVNHMEGHLCSVLLKKNGEKTNLKSQISKMQFPAVALLVSGGHTELILISAQGGPASGWKYKKLGQTRDDAAGEAFDKVAKMMKLGYPGGPIISKLASKFDGSLPARKTDSTSIKLPRPMINSKDFDFSFSGLKTAVLYTIKKIPRLSPNIKKEIAYEFQQAVIDVLISKTKRAVEKYKAQTVIVGGGVVANKKLRKEMKKVFPKVLLPEVKYTGDNAVMIALAGYFRYQNKKPAHKVRALKANGNLKIA